MPFDGGLPRSRSQISPTRLPVARKIRSAAWLQQLDANDVPSARIQTNSDNRHSDASWGCVVTTSQPGTFDAVGAVHPNLNTGLPTHWKKQVFMGSGPPPGSKSGGVPERQLGKGTNLDTSPSACSRPAKNDTREADGSCRPALAAQTARHACCERARERGS